jgi:tetratricopeptide (TPR) repeat protein
VGYDELRRIIREEEPPRPSTRISTLGKAATSVSAHRKSDPQRLSQLCRGELDWIVMKALDKDRNRRYETASAFAADVQRYLHDEPVLACPPSTAYCVRKFVWRYKGPVVATSLVLLCLIGGIIGTSWGMVRAVEAENAARSEGIEKDKAAKEAQRQAAIATGISESLKQMLGSFVPSAGKGPEYSARQLLDDYADNLETKVADQPEVAADLHLVVGRAYACLAARDKAKRHLSRGLALRLDLFGDRHEKYAEALVEYARPDATFEWARCETDLRRALAIYRERGVAGEPIIYTLYVLQWLLAERARGGLTAKWDDVEAVLQEGLAEARKFPGQEFPKIADLHGGCACAKMARGQYADAETITLDALALGQKLYGPDAYPAAWGYFNLADAQRHQGKFREATRADKHALAILRKVLPPGHKCIAWALTAAQKTFDGADKAHALATLFASATELGDWESAFRDVLATTRPGKLDDDDPVLSAFNGLARCGGLYLQLGDEWAAAGKPKKAEEARRRAAKIWEGFPAPFAGDPRLLPYAYGYGTVALVKAGRPRQAKELCGKLLDERVPQVSGPCNNLAWFLATAEAPAHRDPVLATELAERAAASEPRNGGYRNTLGVARYRTGDWKQAIADLEQSAALSKGGTSFDWFFLAMAHWRTGNKDEARKWYDRAVRWMDKNQPKDVELRRFRAEAEHLLSVGPKKK